MSLLVTGRVAPPGAPDVDFTSGSLFVKIASIRDPYQMALQAIRFTVFNLLLDK
jgi:hypothetical protein